MGSTFYGILVLMFYRDNRRHHLPHIHARYQGEEASVALEDGSVLEGKFEFENGERRRFDMRPLLAMKPWNRIAGQ